MAGATDYTHRAESDYCSAPQSERCLPPCGAFDRKHLLDECYSLPLVTPPGASSGGASE